MEQYSDKIEDFRSRVTRRMIWEALFSLLEEKPLGKISVKMICERFNGNRSTFYNHFDSKYDLLQYGLENVIPEEAGLLSTPAAEGQWSEAKPPHAALFEYVKNNQKFWKNVFAEHGINDDLVCGMSNGTIAFMKRISNGDEHDAFFDEIQAQMYIGAVGNVAIWWLKRGCDIPVSQLNKYVDTLWRYPRKNKKNF